MKQNKIEQFNNIGKDVFQRLCSDFGYVLEDIKIFEIKDRPWSVKHIYTHKLHNLKIVIEQAPYYTDYGFTFFIYNLSNEQSNILYNVPHEKQDEEGNFLVVAANAIFSSVEITNLISGKVWEEFKQIYFK